MADHNDREVSLSSLLEEDRERLTSEIDADRSVESTSKVLEKEVDRLMMRYSQEPVEEQKLLAAQQMMQTVKSSLPVVESVTDVEVWEKQGQTGRMKMNPAGTIFLIAGAGLVLVPSLAHLSTLMCSVIGIVCIGLGGFLLGRAVGRAARKTDDLFESRKKQLSRTRFLVDPDAAYHIMRRMVMTADHLLDGMRNPDTHVQTPERKYLMAEKVSPSDIDFYSELLEGAYFSAKKDPGDKAAAEQIEGILYYLHGKGIDVQDFEDGVSRNFFEFLPSGGSRMTLRPALLKDGKLLKKGLASD